MQRKPRRSITSLHDAAYAGQLGELLTFLNAGARIDSVDEDGCTALWLAVCHNQGSTAKLLRDIGADPNVPGENGRAALHVAVQRADPHALDLLMESKAGPSVALNLVDHEGNTALHLLAHSLNAGTCPEAYSLNGLDTWWDEVAMRLLNAGAHPLLPNQAGATPLDLVSPGNASRIPHWHTATLTAERALLQDLATTASESCNAPGRTVRARL